jgi:hypothetical protein
MPEGGTLQQIFRPLLDVEVWKLEEQISVGTKRLELRKKLWAP